MVGHPMQIHRSRVRGLRPFRLSPTALVWLLVVLSPRIVAAFEERTGEQIYRQQCASCHGAAGEGTAENYPHPLAGDRSVAQLARLIAKTMPEDDPGTCVGEDAEKVAAYIHDAFYSPVAQARNKPPAIELSRLTVRQYRNAVADLVGSFRRAGRWDGPTRPAGRVLQVAPVPRRATGSSSGSTPRSSSTSASPARTPRSSSPHEFSIRWEGSVLAPETGEYEFIVRTEHAARLWVNDDEQPLIDAWVKSGNDTEYRGVDLPARRAGLSAAAGVLQGQAGRGRLEEEEASPPPVKASIALEWKLPHRRRGGDPPAEPVAGRVPRDVRRGDAVPAGRPQRRLGARDVGLEGLGPGDDRRGDRGRRLRRRPPRGSCPASADDAPDREPRLRDFCRQVRRAGLPPAARPTSRSELYVDRQFEAAPDPEAAVKRVVLLVLKSPRFLYREVGGGTDAYDVASPALVRAVGLAARRGAAARPRRPASSRRASRWRARPSGCSPTCGPRSKLREFFLQWLKVDQVPRPGQGPQAVPRVRRGDRLRPADLARAVPGRRRLGRGLRLPPAAAGRHAVPERPAGEVLRRRPAGRRARSRR